MAGLALDDEPQVIRIGERAVFRLPNGVIARVARPSRDAAAAREVQVARWLREQEVDVDQPLAGDQPFMAVGGLAVTFWHEVIGYWAAPADLAAVLRRLHSIEPPTGFPLSEYDPFNRLATRIQAAPTLTPSDRDWLTNRAEQLRIQLTKVERFLPPAVIHADASTGNVLKTGQGKPVLLDLEGVCVGPPEWDLTVTAVHRMLGWHTASEYEEFCTVYGVDVTEWDGFPVFSEVQSLRMTCWLSQNARDDEVEQELRRRLADLVDPSRERMWRPF